MRKFFRILPLVILYLLLSAKSCDNNEQDSRLMERSDAAKARDSITSVFGTGDLDQASLRAFEITAKLKLNDLADYLKIINDSTADKSFKDKAHEMATLLFLPGKHVPAYKPGVVFDSVMVKDPLQRKCDTLYSGQLNFTLRFAGSDAKEKKNTLVQTKTIDIFTVKREKIFGRDTVKVWNVLLGDIR